MFDFDCPGHYFRRIKSVAVTLPCVAGPYTGVNCTLRLTKSSIRKGASIEEGYARRKEGDDARFDDHYGSVQSIATSSGQSDSGLFETNLRDERYLPFEGSGVVSEWQLELPGDPSAKDLCSFDYNTITDVILHVRYTAREGGAQLRAAALENLRSMIKDAAAAGAMRIFSIRHDFPTAWASFKAAPMPGGNNPYAKLAMEFRSEHYPFWSRDRKGSVKSVSLFARAAVDLTVADKADAPRNEDPLTTNSFGDLRVGTLNHVSWPQEPIGKSAIYLSDNSMEDLWVVVTVGWEN